MAKKSTMMMPLAIVVLGSGIGFWWWNSKDKTPVGLVITNSVESSMNPIGKNSDGKDLTANAVEGTWRADENSLSVASESADKPLMVVYEDGTPIHAEVVTLLDYVVDKPGDHLPEECKDEVNEEECGTALMKMHNDVMEKWKALAKDAGATEESLESLFVTQEKSTQEAESIYGPMLSLQSHFVW